MLRYHHHHIPMLLYDLGPGMCGIGEQLLSGDQPVDRRQGASILFRSIWGALALLFAAPWNPLQPVACSRGQPTWSVTGPSTACATAAALPSPKAIRMIWRACKHVCHCGNDTAVGGLSMMTRHMAGRGRAIGTWLHQMQRCLSTLRRASPGWPCMASSLMGAQRAASAQGLQRPCAYHGMCSLPEPGGGTEARQSEVRCFPDTRHPHLQDGGDAHGNGIARHVLLAKKVCGGIDARSLVQRHAPRAALAR